MIKCKSSAIEPNPLYFSKPEKYHKFIPHLKDNPKEAKCERCGVLRVVIPSRLFKGKMAVTYMIDGRREGKPPYCIGR